MPHRPHPAVAVLIAVATTICGVLPVFLAGSLSIQAGGDLGMSAAVVGVLIAAFWASSSIFSRPAGRVTETRGIRFTLLLTAALSLGAMVGVALLAPTWQLFALWMIVAGAANGFGHPPSNALISARVPVRHTGAAFGVKQAAIPLSTLAAGLAIPTIALTLGWRAAFVFGGVLCLALIVSVLLFVPSLPGKARARGTGDGVRGPLLTYFRLMAVSGFFGVAQANVIGGFVVSTAHGRGFSLATSGLIVVGASMAGIAVRVAVGIAADRGVGGTMRTVAAMLVLGAAGLVCIAFGSNAVFIAGCVFAFGAGWGWNGLVHYAVAQRAGPFTASATGLVQGGAYAGGAVGPLLFGLLVSHAGLQVGWTAAAACALAAAITAASAARLEKGLLGA